MNDRLLKKLILEELEKEGILSKIADKFSKKPKEEKSALDDFEKALNKAKGVNHNWKVEKGKDGVDTYKGTLSKLPYVDIFVKFDKVSKDAYEVSGYVVNNKYSSNRTNILTPNQTYTKEELKAGDLAEKLTADIEKVEEKFKTKWWMIDY